ncbi:MAG: DNA repair protein RecO [Magnetococcales bacterium]|nr:DNA repair protein RecO [Magnetococcales bacterium]
MRITSEALALRRLPYRDASWIVTLLTPEYGVVAGVARSARRGGRDGARGALTGFHALEVELRSRTTDGLGTLTRAEITTPRNRLPFLAAGAAAAQLLIEAVHGCVLPGDAGGGVELYDCLNGSLEALDRGFQPLAVVAGGLSRLLGLFGHGWRAADCVGCGGREGLRYFSVRRGGAVCVTCGAPYARHLPEVGKALLTALGERSWPPPLADLTQGELTLMYRLGMAGLARSGARPLNTDPMFRRLVGLDEVEFSGNMRQGG